MSIINPLAREVSAKIVYYGPGLSGKTTSLKHVHTAVRPERRGELISLATEGDRTIFFDFLPLYVERVHSLAVRLQLYTVPGQIFYAATRKLVLNGADGVVFVADSQRAARDANLESLESLRENLDELGVEEESFPIVFQYNKRDLPELMSVREMSDELNWLNAPEFETEATQGTGVIPALKEVTRRVIATLWQRHPSARPAAITEERAMPAEGIAARISSLTAQAAESVTESLAQVERPRVEAPASDAPPGLSFASLWKSAEQPAVLRVENGIRHGDYAGAVRAAAQVLAELLESLPGPGGADGTAAKATLLGLDGREYLRLCRLAAAPEELVKEEDALFALYLLVGAHLKARYVQWDP